MLRDKLLKIEQIVYIVQIECAFVLIIHIMLTVLFKVHTCMGKALVTFGLLFKSYMYHYNVL